MGHYSVAVELSPCLCYAMECFPSDCKDKRELGAGTGEEILEAVFRNEFNMKVCD